MIYRLLARYLSIAIILLLSGGLGHAAQKRPNILLAISDDQSWPHAGAYGC